MTKSDFYGFIGLFVLVGIVVGGAFGIAAMLPTEDTEQIQKRAAKVQFLRQLCREDCFPGTLKSYDPRSELCECFPAVR